MMLRAGRRLHMNVGDPNCTGQDQPCRRESDMPVVVSRAGKVKAAGAKGHYCIGNHLYGSMRIENIVPRKT